MEFKKDDFVRIRTFEDRFVLGLRPDFFDEDPLPQEIIEEIEVETGPTKEELAELKRIEEEQIKEEKARKKAEALEKARLVKEEKAKKAAEAKAKKEAVAKAKLEKELQDAKDQLAEIEAFKELEKEEEAEIIEEVIEEPGE